MGSISVGQVYFYSHVNYSVTKIKPYAFNAVVTFYSHVNYSVTKMK